MQVTVAILDYSGKDGTNVRQTILVAIVFTDIRETISVTIGQLAIADLTLIQLTILITVICGEEYFTDVRFPILVAVLLTNVGNQILIAVRHQTQSCGTCVRDTVRVTIRNTS